MHCVEAGCWGKMRSMKRKRSSIAAFLFGLFIVAAIVPVAARAEEPSPAATARFNTYVSGLEGRLAQQHRTPDGFVVLPADVLRLRTGELVIEKLTPEDGADLPGAMLHHWRGTAFVPGATIADFDHLMRDYDRYPQQYAPQVVSARVLSRNGDRAQVTMRVRQKHVITVVMDTAYDVTMARLDARHQFSLSRSTRIDEIDRAGTAQEHALSASENHGFLWRQNTYWSAEERDGGLYMQIESVSLTRAIPTGLGWAIGPFVESVPRESLEFTLQATRDALKK